MLSPGFLYKLLQDKGVECTVGVPDSLLKHYCAYAFDRGDKTIAANEGGAVALAAGYHLATGKIPLVYMQNSGFGNTVNPLTSLVDPEVYAIPMLLMVGWRGEPGTGDEPQHIKQGRAMEELLQALEIPYTKLSTEPDKVKEQVDKAFRYMSRQSSPYVMLVSAGTFESYKPDSGRVSERFPLTREEALRLIIQLLGDDDIVVSTTGKTSRELFELRAERESGHHRDFLTVGSMGHASQIALGIALEKPGRRVYCIDGDGAALMHMGSMAIIGDKRLNNFRHIIINNGAHESVGGQPTVGFRIDFGEIALGCGYNEVFRVENEEQLVARAADFASTDGPVLLEVMTGLGAREDLGRPTVSPVENKRNFMKFLENPNRYK